ncbi:uncharacterized protein LOC116845253 isoform X2 [Odontomachus brunneus]|uniref:uncharacterized protein LOC116845253 isoform X2 n=1 Tax=Odontomachus brunneus TaxID=486640 RepID=UPI0013F19FF2|nr:uncharacterized protein LOC116845253 isoform X2 [Odontomachus brunneus]
MDCTREDVFAEAVLLLAAVANLSDFEARRCLRPSGNLAGRIKNRGFLRIFSARYSACFSARLSSRRVCVSYSQSFIRAYVLDNIYICILMYALFYVALWYATNIIKRIEKSNREMSTTIANNKTVSTLCRVYYVASNQRHNLTRSFNYAIQLTLALFTENPPQKLDRLILLKNKKTQFEEVIVKTTDAQKVTTRHLEDEMCRLDTELTTTSSKIARLEKIIEKMVFSTNSRTNRPKIQPVLSQPARMNVQGVSSKAPRIRSKTSRSSSRHFHRHCRRNRRLASTGSLSVDLLDNGERRSRLLRQKSDSSNSASAEASSESVVRRRKHISRSPRVAPPSSRRASQ